MTGDIQIIKDIFKIADEQNKFIFIKGGWNIDLSHGKQTREHEDVDFHYDLKDKLFWQQYFQEKGFKPEIKDDRYTVYEKEGSKIDMEAVVVSENTITWKLGGTSKITDVCEEKVFSGFKFRGMKLGVEKYLKEKHAERREKDKHDLEIIQSTLQGRTLQA